MASLFNSSLERNVSAPTTAVINLDFTTEEIDNDEGNNHIENVYETVEIAIPFSITMAVIIILCATALYTKIRRKSLQGRASRNPGVPHISGGVPMCVGAYQNRAFLPENMNNSTLSNSSCSTIASAHLHQHSTLYNIPPPLYQGQNCSSHSSYSSASQSNYDGVVLPCDSYNSSYAQNISSLTIYAQLPQYAEAPPKYEDITKSVDTENSAFNNEDIQLSTNLPNQSERSSITPTNDTEERSTTTDNSLERNKHKIGFKNESETIGNSSLKMDELHDSVMSVASTQGHNDSVLVNMDVDEPGDNETSACNNTTINDANAQNVA